ncbi:DUF4232 domain-containing protein [Nocardia salmonicida]|uniref:DUF4232 domain-containing protein n=1 Tax=Nocardia salmonicida TaxID=53431 RepID=UPI0033CEA2C7
MVPFLPIDPRRPAYAPPTGVLVPDPVVDARVPDCLASELRATSKETVGGSGFAFITLTVTISRPGGERCVLRGQPEVKLLDRGRPIDARFARREPVTEWWEGDVVVGDGLRARLSLRWTAPSCPSPGRHDQVALAWPGAGRVTAPGFEVFPDSCSESEAFGNSAVGVDVLTPEHWRWEDRHPLAPGRFFVRQHDAELGALGEPATFVVALGGNGREVDLSPCPDVEIEATYSAGDVATERYGLNCDAIAYRRADGTPYLPKNNAVLFEFEPALSGTSAEKLTWRLLTPEPLELRLDLPVRVPADAPVQPVEEDAILTAPSVLC